MLTRRTFLVGGASLAGMSVLAIGWSVSQAREEICTGRTIGTSGTNVKLNGWLMIDRANNVTIIMSKAEMGQGIHTGAAMLLADELGADWSQVRLADASIESLYKNRVSLARALPRRPKDHSWQAKGEEDLARLLTLLGGTMVTGGSTSVADLWGPMREAGASARAMLCSAAAKAWGAPVDECEARAGHIVWGSKKSATFGELIDKAKLEHPPTHVTLKDRSKFTIIGQRRNRIEAPSKIDGLARFGIDALPEGLLYASVKMCPTLGGIATGHDSSNVKNTEGIHDIFTVDPYHGGTGGVAVIADNPYIAMRTLCQLSYTWDHGPSKNLSDAEISVALVKAIEGGAQPQYFYSTGDVETKLKQSKPLKMQYEAPYLAHAALEPINCTAQVNECEASIWVSTQIPMAARKAVAKFLGLKEDNVQVHQCLIGGGFGRRLEVDYIVQAVAIARHANGRPVQTIWPRAQDTTHDFYRPACVSQFSGALDKDGKLIAWKNQSASQSISAQALPRAFGIPALAAEMFTDTTNAEGAFDQPYECPNISVTHNTVTLPIPVGNWRSVGHSLHAFFVESFIDEMAVAAHKDPFQFRLDMLTKPEHKRHAYVLRTLMDFSRWQSRPKGDGTTARGMAMHEAFGSVVAQVAEVERRGDTFRVTRVHCVIDCGVAINPNLVEQQMESGIIFGLSAALHQRISIVNGQVQQKYFSEFPLVNMSTCPEICTKVLQCGTEPQGVGEAGTPPIAPAVANALFALTGNRVRHLPLLDPPAPSGGDTWCQSVSTEKPLSCILPPKLPCSGHSDAKSNQN
ncbi:xanthine dehydrogenase family protein molybdopterin-binding subunit [Paraburkholderia nodosa]|uniref:xanthine dehydrogenase family protein molybdopterin-binding subunit n=1 Tax=Paraburkholderia nodosa TaxID=392320 RepID=UPI000487B66E|nr:molybdopterin cofactor-binding domain-containing protein [Paraburkholderia nodosa]